MTDNPVRVLCIDDQRTFNDALQVAIASEPDTVCEHAVTSVAEGLEILDSESIDVVLMDLRLPHVDGIEGTRRVKAEHPDVRVIILTGVADLDMFVRAMAAGADGFVAKDSPLDVVVAAVRDETDPNLMLGEDTLRALRDRVSAGAKPGEWEWTPDLTDREREVLALLAAGVDPQSIARQLGIRVHTCRGYVRNVLVKLGAHSQLEAVAVARRYGFLDGEPTREEATRRRASGY